MRNAKKLIRVTITIPDDILDLADERAARVRRSRSWVISEAVRGFVTRDAPSLTANELRGPGRPGLGEQRLLQLESDLKLTPAERVREAQEMLETALKARPQPRYQQVLSFDRFEDYLAWKKADVLA